MSTSGVGTERTIPWGYGAVVGGAAFILEYLLTYLLWAMTEFPGTFGGAMREFITGQIGDWVFAGWLFYNAHFVDISVPSGFGRSRWNFIDFVAQSSTDILYIVIPGILLVAGVALARIAGATNAGDGAVAGAMVTIGYLPLAVIGVFVFQSNDAAPVLLQAVLLAGIVYPVVVGAVAGGIAAELR